MKPQMAHEHRYEHRMLDDVTHQTGQVKPVARHGNRDISFHFVVSAHGMKTVFFGGQFLLVLSGRFGHVRKQMPKLDILPPCLLVPGGVKRQ